jgi:hypothetical protein
MIFVFGSNLAGVHGAGAARFAYEHHAAKLGVGKGLTGESYALPTCDRELRPLPLDIIATHVERFLECARRYPTLQFQVTRIGCGIAGYTDTDIAPLFLKAPDNVWLPSAWLRAIASDPRRLV